MAMRFWLSRNSAISLREQLTTQIILGVISDDLKPGERLPSVRQLARRYGIHFNTVSSAYQDLARQGWLTTSRGAGAHVRERPPSAAPDSLDVLLDNLFREASQLGISNAAVRERVLQRLSWRSGNRIAVFEPEPELCEILVSEIREFASIAVTALPLRQGYTEAAFAGATVASLASRSAQLRDILPVGVPTVFLRLRSVASALQGQTWPAPDTLVSVLSHSPEVLRSTRNVLLGVGIESEALHLCDLRETDGAAALPASGMIIADLVASRTIGPEYQPRILRVISDVSLEELRSAIAPCDNRE